MGNLLGQKIEPNYRGILNTENLNSPISASLQKITDGEYNISALSLSTEQIGIAGSVQYDWLGATPAGVASKTTMWFDATGRMNWRPGTGAASFVRTFDATGITANRVYTLPNATTTIAGLSVAQTFTQNQTFTGGSGSVIIKDGNIIEYTCNSANYFHASTTGGDFRWTINGNSLASAAMNLTNAGNLVIGHNAATARLHVRGDGTNPVARFESSTGINIVSARQSDYSLIFGQGTLDSFAQIGLQTLNNPILMNTGGNGHTLAYRSNFNKDWPGFMHSFFGSDQIYTTATQTNNLAGIAAFNGTFGISNVAASTFDYRMMNINYTINNTAASNRTATGIFLNATETALNGMTHNLMNLQVGGSSMFSVTNGGLVTSAAAIVSTTFLQGNTLRLTGGGRIVPISDGVLNLTDGAGTSFSRLNFGGTSNSFPALVRQGNTLEVRTADGLSYAQLHAGSLAISGYLFATLSTRYFIDQDSRGVAFNSSVGIRGGNTPNDASAILDVASTIKGVLFPRMTTAQKNAISTPATGLIVFDTDLGKLCVFSTTWQTITSA